MFDARSILDVLVRGGQPQSPARSSDLSDLSDLLKQLAPADRTTTGTSAAPRRAPVDSEEGEVDARTVRRAPLPPAGEEDDASPYGDQPGGGLEDILREVLGGGPGGGSIGDVLRRMQTQGGPGGGGGLGDILGEILGQATSGGRPSRLADAGTAGRREETGGDLLSQVTGRLSELTGRSPDELLAQLKELVANRQFGAGAALGGLGALILGTKTGRSLAGTAAKLGGLAVIGGLAYKAYQDYQRGQSAGAGARPQAQALLAAPEGSGFEPAAVGNDEAILLIRAMIAAAAADGRIDAAEQQRILAGLQQGSLDTAARQFLSREIENPATVDELAAAVTSPEQAVQVYTAARVTVDPDEEEEHAFLADLAGALGIDESLAAHIDAAARSARS
jgi:uncharacterized membrane protein YebE (DUF533 family)